MTTIYETGDYWAGQDNFHESDATFKANCCFDALRKSGFVASIRTVLDVGCGSGKLLHELSKKLPAAESFLGVDLSDLPIERAKAVHAGPRVSFDKKSLGEVTDKYDLVTMFDVFEHVDDYIGFLRQAAPRGRLFYFNIPLDMNAMSVVRHKYMRDRAEVGHLHYFSGASALATLQYAGLTPVYHQYNSMAWENRKYGWTQYVAALPRLLLHRISPSASADLLGGASLSAVCTHD